MSDQFVFDFGKECFPDFEDFQGQGNNELIKTLKEQVESFVYLWGEQGSGKTTLLKSWVAKAQQEGKPATYLDVATMGLPESARELDFIAIDGVEALNEEEQIRLFSIFNQFKDQQQGYLLISANTPPNRLSVREDLRTRMGFCLVYEVVPLTDSEKISLLSAMAKSRQIHLSDDVFVYLLNHWKRDIDSLVQILEQLDRYSLATKKPITVFLVKKLLNLNADYFDHL